MRHSTMATRNQVTAGRGGAKSCTGSEGNSKPFMRNDLIRVRVRVRVRVRARVTVRARVCCCHGSVRTWLG